MATFQGEPPPYPDIGGSDFHVCDEDTKRRLLTEEWTAMTSYQFPTRTFGKPDKDGKFKERRLTAKWLQEKAWMRYSTSNDAVFCVFCVLFGSKSNTFTTGTSDWKNLSTLVKRHEIDTDCHKDALEKGIHYSMIMTGESESINKKVSDTSRDTVNKNRHILKQIIEVILLCTRQNIPLRGHEEKDSNFFAILNTFAKNDPILSEHLANSHYNAKYTSPEIQNELIGICSDQLKDSIVEECRKCPHFAIMVDEATDKSRTEQLSMCVRFIDEAGSVREEFLGFIECSSIKGVALCHEIITFPQNNNLDILKIRAQCYDGASNMSGKYNGLQALVRERAPHANYVHCKSHCLNLSFVHSCNIQCVRTMMATLQDITFHFDYSAKRLHEFKDELSRDANTQEEMEGREKLRKLCTTRWTSRTESLKTMRASFRVAVHALENLQDDGDDKSGQYLSAILRFDFIIAMVVAEHVLTSTEKLTILLQKTDNDLIHAVDETKVVIAVLNAERQDPEVWNSIYDRAERIAREFQIEPSRPRRVGRQQHRANPDIQDVSEYWKVTLYFVLIDHLVQEMTTRVLGNGHRYLAGLLLPTKLPNLQDNALADIYAAYSQDMPDDGSYEAFRNEITRWRMKWTIADQRPSRLDETLKLTHKYLYPCIHAMISVLLTMPPSSATCERSFSSMKRIKNYLRTTMGSERLSGLGILHIHKGMDVDVERIINTFASRKSRKFDFF